MVLIDKCHHNTESALILNQTNWVLWNKAFDKGCFNNLAYTLSVKRTSTATF